MLITKSYAVPVTIQDLTGPSIPSDSHGYYQLYPMLA